MNNNQTDNWTLRDLWDLLMDNIWVYVVSCVVALVIAGGYILVSPPQYERTASILIKDDEQGQSVSSQMMQGFGSMGLFQSTTNINNEIKLIKTTAFMTEVVERLKLNNVYEQKTSVFKWEDLYKRTPFTVAVDSSMLKQYFSFRLEFTSAETFEISDYTIYERNEQIKVKLELKGTLNSKVETPYGSFSIAATPFLDKDNIVGEKFSFSKEASDFVAKEYLEKLKVLRSSDDTSIVDLTITDNDTERAENILNTLISVYNENWIKDKNEITFNTSKFIDGRLGVIEQELESVDGSIAQFKSDKLMPDVATVTGIQLQQSTQNVNNQLVVKNQLSMAKYIQGYIESTTNSDQLLPTNTGIENSAIETQIGNYNELLLQKNLLLANSSENNPLVADMITSLQAIKDVINMSIKDHISTLTIQLSNLQKEDGQNRANLSSTPKQAKELLGVERQQMIKEQLFLYLLQKREENELSQAFSAYNTKVLSVADGSPFPMAPKKSMILMLALSLAVIFSTLYVIAKEAFDTLVSNKKDVEHLSIPYVGSIPHVAPTKGSKGEQSLNIIVNDGDRDPANEAFRVLRTNLDFMIDRSKSGAQVIQLISLVPSSGKSFISTNLALSMALKDSKVLLIDCDIRKRTLSNGLTDGKRFGLSDYLSQRHDDLDRLLVKCPVNNNIDVLLAGTVAPNPSELLLKPGFEQIINTMKERYDYIFIDCPPVDIVPDAAIVGKFCDTSIFVIRAGNLDKRLLPDVEALYNNKKYNNMCLLLNGVKRKGKGYGRYGYYGYGYGTEE